MENKNVPMRKYEIRLEVINLIDVKVAATSPEEAIKKAKQGNDGKIDYIELQEISL